MSAPSGRFNAFKDLAAHTQNAYGHYQVATDTHSFPQTIQHAWQHRNETMFGSWGGPYTYGVKPFAHPVASAQTAWEANQAKRAASIAFAPLW